MNTNSMRLLLFFLLGSLLLSCSKEKELKDYSPFLEQVMITQEGSLRGNSIGDLPGDIRTREIAPLSDEADHYLYYSGTLNENSNYIISYYFDRDGLYEGNLDVYFSDSPDAAELYQALTAYLNDKYGSPEDHDGLKTWPVKEGKYPGEISVNCELQDSGSSYVTISLLKQD